ncbi:MAG: di-trans,poly-cis-decaprenylcistransferase [Deltaproteobacteria bacterium]|nr:di-trans,poly-cis-decaprenylcistransferase [Deltaproteobacteria bacterium]
MGGLRMIDAFGRAARGVLERAYAERLRREVLASEVPGHVAVILDGNRRHARLHGLAATDGHLLGSETLEQLLEWCRRLGVHTLTVYALSTENLRRDPDEVRALMDLFACKLTELAADERVHKNRIRVRVLGRLDQLRPDVAAAAARAEAATATYDAFEFRICLAYGGRQEIVDAVRSIADDVAAGHLDPATVDEGLLGARLCAGADEPDLLIRTGGEVRLSNFMLFQAAYSELVFTDVHFPAFRELDFLRLVRTYQQRVRRFGR